MAPRCGDRERSLRTFTAEDLAMQATALTTLGWCCGLALPFGEANWTAGPADHPNMVGRATTEVLIQPTKGLNRHGDQKNIWPVVWLILEGIWKTVKTPRTKMWLKMGASKLLFFCARLPERVKPRRSWIKSLPNLEGKGKSPRWDVPEPVGGRPAN